VQAQFTDPSSVLVRMPNWLGDLVMATGAIAQIRKQWPKAQITALCSEPLAPILKHDPRLDALITFRRKGRCMPKGLRQQLREGQFDLGVLLTNSWSSAWWMWRGGVKQRLGYAMHQRRILLTHAAPLPTNWEQRHQVELYCDLIEAPAVMPQLFVQEEERAWARQKLTEWGLEGKRIIALSTQAAFGPAKRWPLERFRAAAQELLKSPDVGLLWVGDPSGRTEIGAAIGNLPRCVNAAGLTDLRQLMALLAVSDLLLTNDSGPMHLGSALSTPVVALFGPTNPTQTRPYNGGTLIYKNVSCSPCYRRTCPIDHRCMLQISVKEVVDTVHRQLLG
jgi:heptosyltransferase II